jgi:hypothetical protein
MINKNLTIQKPLSIESTDATAEQLVRYMAHDGRLKQIIERHANDVDFLHTIVNTLNTKGAIKHGKGHADLYMQYLSTADHQTHLDLFEVQRRMFEQWRFYNNAHADVIANTAHTVSTPTPTKITTEPDLREMGFTFLNDLPEYFNDLWPYILQFSDEFYLTTFGIVIGLSLWCYYKVYYSNEEPPEEPENDHEEAKKSKWLLFNLKKDKNKKKINKQT